MRDTCSAISNCCYLSEIYQSKTQLESINICQNFKTYMGEFEGLFGDDLDSLVHQWSPELNEYEWTIHNFCQVYRNLTEAGQVPQTSFRMCQCYGDKEPTYNSNARFVNNTSSDSDFSDVPDAPAHTFDTQKCTRNSGDQRGCVEINDCCTMDQHLPSYKTTHNFCFNWRALNYLYGGNNQSTTIFNVCNIANSTYENITMCTCVSFGGILGRNLLLLLSVALAFWFNLLL